MYFTNRRILRAFAFIKSMYLVNEINKNEFQYLYLMYMEEKMAIEVVGVQNKDGEVTLRQ